MAKNELIFKTFKKNTFYIVGLALVLVSITAVLVKINNDHSASKNTTTQQPSFEDQRRMNARLMLEAKNYDSYQYNMLFITTAYQYRSDYSSSQRILDEILKNVPTDKIVNDTYVALSSQYKATGDKLKYKKYTDILIAKLTAQGDSKQAALYQQDMANFIKK